MNTLKNSSFLLLLKSVFEHEFTIHLKTCTFVSLNERAETNYEFLRVPGPLQSSNPLQNLFFEIRQGSGEVSDSFG